MDAQLKKGVLELCLLQCLSGEPKYGYDVIQTMRDLLCHPPPPGQGGRGGHLPGQRVQRPGTEVLPPHPRGPGPAGEYGRGLAEPSGHHAKARH